MSSTEARFVLPRLSYTEALAIQKQNWFKPELITHSLSLQLQGQPFRALVFESEPVWTLGRQCRIQSLPSGILEIRRRGGFVIEVDRGGAATYHGPGQILFFPMPEVGATEIDKKRLIQLGPKLWVHTMEEMIRASAEDFHVELKRLPGFPGLYSPLSEKVLAIGLRFTSSSLLHGMALNWAFESLKGFDLIDPCGLRGIRAQCILRLTQDRISIKDFLERMQIGFRSTEVLSSAANCHH